jgi:SAM-dependent methyltransferase
MQMPFRVRNQVRALLQAYGTAAIKKRLWNREYADGRWDCLDDTRGDCVYRFVERYAAGGTILDLGCGSGSTANELSLTTYRGYTGVDISEVALTKARERSAENGREGRTSYVRSDIYRYVPNGRFDVILFRDSIYYIPPARISGMLERYASYLRKDGVFVVRMASEQKYRGLARAIEDRFDILERHVSHAPEAIVIVFRPRRVSG